MNGQAGPDKQDIQESREMLGNKIRLIRESRGYTQTQIAGMMNVHSSTISKIEAGKFPITVDYLAKLAWYLRFEISLIEKPNKE